MSRKVKPVEEILQELRAFGFPIKDTSFLSELFENGACSFHDAYEELLATDFRKSSFLNPTFGATINTAEADSLKGPVVLQVNSVANVSQPSRRQHEDSNPRMLLLKLTDGSTTASAIEYERISDLSTKVPPGTKLLIKNSLKICSGKILLMCNSCQVLGGRVDHLFKAWQTNRATMSNRKQKKHEGAGEGEAPPMFEFAIDGAAPSERSTAAKKDGDSKLDERGSKHDSGKNSTGRQSKRGGPPAKYVGKNDRSLPPPPVDASVVQPPAPPPKNPKARHSQNSYKEKKHAGSGSGNKMNQSNIIDKKKPDTRMSESKTSRNSGDSNSGKQKHKLGNKKQPKNAPVEQSHGASLLDFVATAKKPNQLNNTDSISSIHNHPVKDFRSMSITIPDSSLPKTENKNDLEISAKSQKLSSGSTKKGAEAKNRINRVKNNSRKSREPSKQEAGGKKYTFT